MRVLCKFYRYFGRQGSLRGLFVARPEDVEGVIGRRVYFGEVLGKHSDVACVLEAEDFTHLTSDTVFIT